MIDTRSIRYSLEPGEYFVRIARIKLCALLSFYLGCQFWRFRKRQEEDLRRELWDHSGTPRPSLKEYTRILGYSLANSANSTE